MFRGYVRSCNSPVGGISGANALRATGVRHGALPLGTSHVNVPLVYFVPGLGRTLASISALAAVGLSTTFTRVFKSKPTSHRVISNDSTGLTLLSIPCSSGLYSYKPPVTSGTSVTAIFQADVHPSPPYKLRGLLAGYAGFMT